MLLRAYQDLSLHNASRGAFGGFGIYLPGCGPSAEPARKACFFEKSKNFLSKSLFAKKNQKTFASKAIS
jgi:hypothetical protein